MIKFQTKATFIPDPLNEAILKTIAENPAIRQPDVVQMYREYRSPVSIRQRLETLEYQRMIRRIRQGTQYRLYAATHAEDAE